MIIHRHRESGKEPYAIKREVRRALKASLTPQGSSLMLSLLGLSDRIKGLFKACSLLC
jgi:hypothetical protein